MQNDLKCILCDHKSAMFNEVSINYPNEIARSHKHTQLMHSDLLQCGGRRMRNSSKFGSEHFVGQIGHLGTIGKDILMIS